MSRKHRPASLDLSPQGQHLSLFESNYPCAIEGSTLAHSLASRSSNVGLGTPSPAHYSQRDLLHLLDSNPRLTPVLPLRTAPLVPANGELGVDLTLSLSPGLPPASHSMEVVGDPIDEVFVELASTENSFLEELDTIGMVLKEILVPLEIVSSEWLEAVSKLNSLHREFVRQLGVHERVVLTPPTLKSILNWVSLSKLAWV
jgi:hypothetical protein